MVVPLTVGLILHLISTKKIYRNSTVLAKARRTALGTFTFYGLMFLAYGEIIALALNLKYLDLGLSSGIGIGVGVLYCLVLMGYLIASSQYPLSFGSFKKHFEKYTISSYFYTFSAIERMLTCFLVAFMSPLSFTALAVSLPLSLEAVFILVKRPYVLDRWKRPLFNKTVSILLCLLYFGVNMLEESSSVVLYMPLVVLALLGATLVVAVYNGISEVK